MVLAPDAEGNWIEYTNKTDIEVACFQENSRRFRQADQTPFMISPLLDEVGLLGMGPATVGILDGTYQPPEGADPWAAHLISYLGRGPGVDASSTVSVAITMEDHIAGWRKAHEQTSLGPSGLHFGHCKAGCTVH